MTVFTKRMEYIKKNLKRERERHSDHQTGWWSGPLMAPLYPLTTLSLSLLFNSPFYLCLSNYCTICFNNNTFLPPLYYLFFKKKLFQALIPSTSYKSSTLCQTFIVHLHFVYNLQNRERTAKERARRISHPWKFLVPYFA